MTLARVLYGGLRGRRWYLGAMATADDDFHQWVADQGGPDAVVAMVAEARRQVENGTLPGFTSKEEFLAYMRRRDIRSA